MTNLEKAFFKATGKEFAERLNQRPRGFLTESMVLTANYLRWLHNTPDRPAYRNGKFKG